MTLWETEQGGDDNLALLGAGVATVAAQLSTAFLTFYGVQEYSASCQANCQGEYQGVKGCRAAADWFRVRLNVKVNTQR